MTADIIIADRPTFDNKSTITRSQSYAWKKADWGSFEEALQQWNWNHFYDSGNVDQIFKNIKDCIWSSCHKCVPLLPSKRKRRLAWETSAVRQARKSRRDAEHNHRLKRNEETRIARNRAANHLKQTVRKAVLDYERNIALSEDPKRFWSYVRKIQKPHPKVGPLYDPKYGLLTNEPKRCAELFAEVYASYFTTDDNRTPSVPPATSAEVRTINFRPALVQAQLKRMRNGASPGPDGITYTMLRGGGSFLLHQLHQLSLFFQYCMDNSIIPTD